MKRLLFALIFLIATFASPSPAIAAPGDVKALRLGKLVDGKGKVWTDAIVIVRGDRITYVGTDAAQIPTDAEVIDLRRFTGIPGLIDVHTHMTYFWD